MDAKRLLCPVVLASLLVGCGQPAATPTPTAAPLRFNDPCGIFVDEVGRIYVADQGNNCIVRMDDMSGDRWIAYGSFGDGVGQFNSPVDVFLDSAGKIYVSDSGNHRIVRMDDMAGSNWTTLGRQWTSDRAGSGAGEFYWPAGVFVAPDGKIYVGDPGNNRIVRVDDMSGSNWIAYGPASPQTGQLQQPTNIAVDAGGRIYFTDVSNNCIVRIDDIIGSNWISYGPPGGFDIYLDLQGRIYVSEYYQIVRIVRIDDMDGTNRTTYGSKGRGTGQFVNAPAIAVDAAGRIYAIDSSGRLVRIDDMNGTNWTTFP